MAENAPFVIACAVFQTWSISHGSKSALNSVFRFVLIINGKIASCCCADCDCARLLAHIVLLALYDLPRCKGDYVAGARAGTSFSVKKIVVGCHQNKHMIGTSVS